MGNNLISVDNASDKAYLHVGITTAIDTEFSTALLVPCSVVWDGTDVYDQQNTGSQTSNQYTGFTSAVQNTVDLTGGTGNQPYGLTCDGDGNFYSTVRSESLHKQWDGHSTSLLDSIATYDGGSSELSHDGTNLLVSTFTADDLIRLVGFTTAVDTQINSPSSTPTGVGWTGTNALSCDSGTNNLYENVGFTTALNTTIAGPSTNPWGVGWENFTDRIGGGSGGNGGSAIFSAANF